MKILLLIVALCSIASAQTTRPVIMLRPAPGTVIENLNLNGQAGAQQYGIYINCYPSAKDPTYVCKGLIIRNCKVDGFQINVCVIGPQQGTQIYGNTIVNSTGTWATMNGGGHSHGLYTEGLQANCQIHDNLIANNGWWPSYDPTQANQRTIANLNHGWYGNESASMDDTTQFYNNIVIDNVGSNVACRHALHAWNNVFRGVGDQDLIVEQYGSGSVIFFNACFGPRLDAIPYYGGGIHLMGPGQCFGNLFSGSAKTTNNPTAIDSTGSVIPQIGYWPKPGATLSALGVKRPTLEDWCQAAYGVASALKPGDAPKITAWLAGKLVN